MKHIYESEVLHKLMERDGFNIPSSVPPYESEIKAYLINQVKLAYPKLTDYEAEWLLYNYTKHLPADFPINSVSNVSTATFENVVPFAYQSAILKGQTLVNHFPPFNSNCWEARNGSVMHDGYAILKANEAADFRPKANYRNYPTLKPSTKYTYIYYVSENVGNVSIGAANGFPFSGSHTGLGVGLHKSLVTTPEEIQGSYISQWFVIKADDRENGYAKITMMMLIEGDWTNTELPFKEHFDGMQSVKMPVLTTVGKNLFDGELELGSYDGSGRPSSSAAVLYRNKNKYISVVGGSNISCNQCIFVHQYDKNKKFITYSQIQPSSKTMKLEDNTWFINFRTPDANYENIQIEYGTVVTSYEPYKSNILSTPSDLELRGVSDVQDTLDCLTGEVTERIGEVVLDGINNKVISINEENGIKRFDLNINGFKVYPSEFGEGWFNTNKCMKCDKLTTGLYNNNISYNHLYAWYGVAVITLNSGINSIEQANEYLQQNHITIQYQLETESVKKVDLTTVNENGESVYFMPLEGTMHVHSSGEIIQPTFDMSVPVEATTQNLASFINLDIEGE